MEIGGSCSVGLVLVSTFSLTGTSAANDPARTRSLVATQGATTVRQRSLVSVCPAKACVPIKRFSGIKKQPLPLLPPGLKIAHVPEIAHAEVGPGSDYRRGHLVGLGNISRWEIFFRKV